MTSGHVHPPLLTLPMVVKIVCDVRASRPEMGVFIGDTRGMFCFWLRQVRCVVHWIRSGYFLCLRQDGKTGRRGRRGGCGTGDNWFVGRVAFAAVGCCLLLIMAMLGWSILLGQDPRAWPDQRHAICGGSNI